MTKIDDSVYSYKGHTLEVETEEVFNETKKWWTVVFPDGDRCQMYVGYTNHSVSETLFQSWVDFHIRHGYEPKKNEF